MNVKRNNIGWMNMWDYSGEPQEYIDHKNNPECKGKAKETSNHRSCVSTIYCENCGIEYSIDSSG